RGSYRGSSERSNEHDDVVERDALDPKPAERDDGERRSDGLRDDLDGAQSERGTRAARRTPAPTTHRLERRAELRRDRLPRRALGAPLLCVRCDAGAELGAVPAAAP